MEPAILLPAASYEFATIQKVSGGGPPVPASDQLAAEEPLEIRVGYEVDAHERTCSGAASSGQPAESTACYDVEKCHTHQKIPEMQAEQF